MCKNFAVFIAGTAALSFLGLGARVVIADGMGAQIGAVCPICEIVFWAAVFALPFFVGLFIGVFSGQRGWFCAGLAAITAFVIRSAVAGPTIGRMTHTPLLAVMSVLYLISAVVGGVAGAAITARRIRSSRDRYVPAPVAAHTPGTAQSHSHDNMAF